MASRPSSPHGGPVRPGCQGREHAPDRCGVLLKTKPKKGKKSQVKNQNCKVNTEGHANRRVAPSKNDKPMQHYYLPLRRRMTFSPAWRTRPRVPGVGVASRKSLSGTYQARNLQDPNGGVPRLSPLRGGPVPRVPRVGVPPMLQRRLPRVADPFQGARGGSSGIQAVAGRFERRTVYYPVFPK